MSTATVILRTKWHVAALQVQIALLRCRLIFRAYNPSQPRVPPGNPTGGQWTSEDGGGTYSSGDNAHISPINDQDEHRYNVLLREEEARGGHTISEHVGKTDLEMLRRIQLERYELTFLRLADSAMDHLIRSIRQMILSTEPLKETKKRSTWSQMDEQIALF